VEKRFVSLFYSITWGGGGRRKAGWRQAKAARCQLDGGKPLPVFWLFDTDQFISSALKIDFFKQQKF
jgi:hypothetical protein